MSLEKFSIIKALQAAMNYFAAGNLSRAESVCRDIIKAAPGTAEAYNLLGVISDRNGNPGLGAEFIARAISLAPNTAGYYNNLGNAYGGIESYDEAITAYNNAIRLDPSFAEAYNNLGNALKETDNVLEAITNYKKALQLNPDSPVCFYNLGRALEKIGVIEGAISVYQRAVALKPDFVDANFYLGRILKEECRFAEAERYLRKVISCKPDHVGAIKSLGSIFRDMGDFDNALAHYRKALQLKPDYCEVHYLIASMVSQRTTSFYSATHEDVICVKQLLDSKQLGVDEEIDLHFALGDMYDNCDLFEEAFAHYRQANQLKRAKIEFSEKQTEEFISKIKGVFSKEFYEQRKFTGSESSAPIFVIGLPRSGKSLTETLISTHKEVFAGDELAKIAALINRELPVKLKSKEKFPGIIERIENRHVLELAGEYEKYITHLAGGACRYISNTLPYSIFYLGMIALMFPKAKIIYCRRNALDNCLSIFFTGFGMGNLYGFDLRETGFFYRQYEQLMTYWRELLPLAIHEVRYEDMIGDPEGMAKDLVDFLGLAWDAECSAALFRKLSPARQEENGLPVQFLHDRFIGRAQKYEKFLGPLYAGLKAETPKQQ